MCCPFSDHQVTFRSKSKLRQAVSPTFGPHYSATKIRREALTDSFGDTFGGSSDDDDDAFAKRDDLNDIDSRHGSSEDESDVEEGEFDDPDDPDIVNPAAQMDIDDEEIDSDEAFGDGDDELFQRKGFSFGGNAVSESQTINANIEGESTEEEFAGFNEDREATRDHGVCDGMAARDKAGSESEGAELEEDSSGEELGSSDQSSESMPSDEESDTGDTSPEEPEGMSIDRAALREMMAAEQKQIVANISEATKADAAKGYAVKQQYSAFDALVGMRIQLQKALVAANSLSVEPTGSPDPSHTSSELSAAADAAETAALKLLNSITLLQEDISKRQPSPDEAAPNPLKRSFSATLTTPTHSIHTALTDLSSSFAPHRRSSLLKWSAKTAPISTLAARNKLTAAPTQQSLTSVLDSYLQDPSLTRLTQRTQIPRSCAPLQAAAAAATATTTTTTSQAPEDASIFDDADFYAVLLRELIEHKKSCTGAASFSNAATNGGNMTNGTSLLDPAIEAASSLRATKTHRRNVDRQASKGRKMRFNVHEKLLNFVAPQEMPSTGWEREKREEFFRGLFGRRLGGAERERDEDEDEDEGEMKMGGLRLFAGV